MLLQESPSFLGVDIAKLTLAIQFADQLWSMATHHRSRRALQCATTPSSKRSTPALRKLTVLLNRLLKNPHFTLVS